MMDVRSLGLPVRRWVPDWLAVAALFIVILPVLMVNGAYTGSMLEVSNTLGTNTEDITMAYYAASAGMAIGYPIVPKVLSAFPAKPLLLADLVLQFFLSWICARSQNADILIVASFVIGFLKGFMMLWFIRIVKFIFSPKDVRSEFYSYFYPLVFGFGQLSMVLTAELAYHYDWKYMYYFEMALMLLSVLTVIICFRQDKDRTGLPIEELHLREMLVAAVGVLMLMYVADYGKMLDWMASFKIRAYLVIGPILIAFFIWLQAHAEKPFVNLAPLYQPKAIVGYLYMMLVMFFSTSTTLLTNYMTSILQVDSARTYLLYIWMLPGYVLGAFICFWWFRWQRWRFRFLMLVVIIAFALFSVEDLNPKFLLSNAFFLILSRSVLAPIMATSFYSNVLYHLQQKYMHSLSETLTMADPLAASRFSQSLSSGIGQGHGYAEAAQMATSSLYATLQQQSLLLALKDILGWLFIVTLVIAIVSRFIPFHKTIRVTFAKAGDDMV